MPGLDPARRARCFWTATDREFLPLAVKDWAWTSRRRPSLRHHHDHSDVGASESRDDGAHDGIAQGTQKSGEEILPRHAAPDQQCGPRIHDISDDVSAQQQ